MRLINTHSLDLEEYFGSEVPRNSYAERAGYKKIKVACDRARLAGLSYLWADTNCIDKKSSAELSEAINSMFKWYRDSDRCYVYLADFCLDAGNLTQRPGSINLEQLRRCRWFTRGWTLQELLAPYNITFFDSDWRRIGQKADPEFRALLSRVVNIRPKYLDILKSHHAIFKASVSERMSWVAHRQTTREEDIAYCMLGIFEIDMPLLYGEGNRAFLRLQEEIIRTSNDQTIFCWDNPIPCGFSGSVLAFNPCAFAGSEELCYRKFFDLERNDQLALTQENGYHLALLPGSDIEIRHVHRKGYSYTAARMGKGRAPCEFFRYPHKTPVQGEVDCIVLDVKRRKTIEPDSGERSIVIAYKPSKGTPRWQVEAVLRGSSTEDRTEIPRLVYARLRNFDGATNSSHAVSNRHDLSVFDADKENRFFFALIDTRLLDEWHRHLQTFEEFRASGGITRTESKGS
ncbi:hypothetical protein NUW58_g2120 [Xylaria curta]|uniref:Uncharacterized protein n=1 Tax=Xylaria curta TaxID=42375 RepID=A0ACC1PH88_9PEZI|nr:hypothetical protein NUW58_g2120 [Xylaria curta]